MHPPEKKALWSIGDPPVENNINQAIWTLLDPPEIIIKEIYMYEIWYKETIKQAIWSIGDPKVTESS